MGFAQEAKELRSAGFSDEEVGEWAASKRKDLSQAGFNQGEIDIYFGQPPFNPKPIEKHVTENLTAATKPETEGGQPKPVTSFMEAVEAGLQISIGLPGLGGLLGRGEGPSKVLAEDASRVSRIASNVATLAGDFPAMVGGAMIGGATPVTAIAGAFALPAGLRTILMDKYEKGEVTSFSDFWDRLSGSVIDTAKGWITGAATGLAGKAAGLLPIASPTAKAAMTLASEVPTMVAVGQALEGQIPEPDDFIDAAIVIGGLKGAVKTVGKLRNLYARTGVSPDQVALDIAKDPTILPELMADNIEIPKTYAKEIERFYGQIREVEDLTGKPIRPRQGPFAPGETLARTPESEITPVPLSTAQEAILSRVVQAPAEKKATTLSDLYTKYVDNLNPINKAEREATGGELEIPERSPYILERLTRGIFGKGQHFLKHGPFDAETYKTVGKSYDEILKPVEKDLDGFRAYMVAKRVLEIDSQGKETGIDLEAAKTVVREGRGKYEAVFKDRLKYRDAMLEYLHKSGILSDEAVNAMREAHKDYVPFYRFFEEESRPGTSTKVFNPIKALKGSERKIIDPIESDIKDTFLFLGLAERNVARQAFVALGPEFAQKVPTPIRPIELKKEEIQRLFPDTDVEVATIFRAFSLPLAKDEVVVYFEGKRQVYKADSSVAEAFNATDRTSSGFLANMLNTPAILLRAGTVLNPDFMYRNVIRDAISSFVYAGSNPIKTVKGAVSLAKKDTVFQNWLKGGGANATMVAIDRDYIQAELYKLNAETSVMERAWNVVKKPIEILQVASELLENATRLGAVRSELINAKDKAAIQAASYLAREATVDFSRHGSDPFFQKYTRMAAFMNPGIQGMDRMFRAIKEDPTGVFAKAFVSVTIPSLLLWWANHDDPRYQELPRWQKDLFHIIMTEKHVFRVPKSFELGMLFGTVPERLLDAFFTDNPNALKDLDKSLMSAFGVNTVPTFVAPVIEQFANRSMFTGNPLIPNHMESLLPEYQYTEYTTETAKAIGALIGAFPGVTKRAISDEDTFVGGAARALTTPVLIENYLRSWTGGLGMYTLQLADAALRKSGVAPDPVLPAKTLADIPFVKAFAVRYPSASAQSIQDFYDTYYSKKKVYDTVIKKAQEGDLEAVEKVMTFDESAIVQLDGIREALTDHSMMVRLIYKNPDIPAGEKRQLIDTLYFRMIELSQAGNEALREIERSFAQ